MISGGVQLALGFCYIVGVGGLSAFDVARTWAREHRIVWFGVGLMAIASACGPHHLHLGYHQVTGDPAANVDLLTTLWALPFGAAWLWCRVESVVLHGPGDRLSTRVSVGPILLAGLALSYGAAVPVAYGGGGGDLVGALPQFAQASCYVVIGWLLWDAQIDRWLNEQDWSLAGVSLAMIFPTCALQHYVYGLLVARGAYVTDPHFLVIDWWGVAAGLWMVWLVFDVRRAARPVSPRG